MRRSVSGAGWGLTTVCAPAYGADRGTACMTFARSSSLATEGAPISRQPAPTSDSQPAPQPAASAASAELLRLRRLALLLAPAPLPLPGGHSFAVAPREQLRRLRLLSLLLALAPPLLLRQLALLLLT